MNIDGIEYGKSPLQSALRHIIARSISASYVMVRPECIRDIKKMKLKKKRKSDVKYLTKICAKQKIKFIKTSLTPIELDFVAMNHQAQLDMYSAFKIPKEYLQTTL